MPSRCGPIAARAAGAKAASITSQAGRFPEDPLLILAIDTTTRAGSTAVIDDGRVIVEITGDAAITHGQRLPGDIGRTLAAAHVELSQIALLAVVAGPGSFTGLRIGIASIQGLAFARALKIVPVSALEAIAGIAGRAGGGGRRVAAWVDAHRGEVYSCLFGGSPLRELTPPASASPEATLHAWRDLLGQAPVVFAGDGAVRYREAIGAQAGGAEILDPPPPLAGEAGRIAAAHPERAVAPNAIVPIYVRRPDVELARERTAGR